MHSYIARGQSVYNYIGWKCATKCSVTEVTQWVGDNHCIASLWWLHHAGIETIHTLHAVAACSKWGLPHGNKLKTGRALAEHVWWSSAWSRMVHMTQYNLPWHNLRPEMYNAHSQLWLETGWKWRRHVTNGVYIQSLNSLHVLNN